MREYRGGELAVEGLYLYCVIESAQRDKRISATSIDGKGEVFTIPCRGLEAVVSKVSLKEFASEDIQKRAREDLNWIKEKSLAHENVVETAMMNNNCLIPMRFGTIFKGRARLKEALEKDYPKIKKVLDKIRGKQEWSLKVYLKDKKKLEQAIKKKNEVIKEKEKEIASLPEGTAFFMEEEIKELISKEINKEIDGLSEDVFQRLAKVAVASAKNKILGNELTGRREPMILNAAYLIPEEKIENFKREALSLGKKIKAKGSYFEYSGPWPAYSFASW